MSGGGAEREGDTESQAGSALSMQSLMLGLNSWNRVIMTWAETKSLTDWATQVPRVLLLF